MSEGDQREHDAIRAYLREHVEADNLRITAHAHQEMVEDGVSLDEIREVLSDALVLERYPQHKRGPCCLVCGRTSLRRYVHIVCTTSLDPAIIITVYVPEPPKWLTPFERSRGE